MAPKACSARAVAPAAWEEGEPGATVCEGPVRPATAAPPNATTAASTPAIWGKLRRNRICRPPGRQPLSADDEDALLNRACARRHNGDSPPGACPREPTTRAPEAATASSTSHST